jgi:hypothetical protein
MTTNSDKSSNNNNTGRQARRHAGRDGTHHILVVFPVGNDDLNGRQMIVHPVELHRGAHGVLQQLHQDVLHVVGDGGHVQVQAAMDGDIWSFAVSAGAHVCGVFDSALGDFVGRCGPVYDTDHVGIFAGDLYAGCDRERNGVSELLWWYYEESAYLQ